MNRIFQIIIMVVLLSSESWGEVRKNVWMSKANNGAWSKFINIEVQFVFGGEKEEYFKGAARSKAFALIWFSKDNVAIVELASSAGFRSVFDELSFLSLFMPTGVVTGKQINAADNTEVKYAFQAPWISCSEETKKFFRGISDRGGSSGMRIANVYKNLYEDDRKGAMRNLRFAKNEAKRENNMMMQGGIGILISELELIKWEDGAYKLLK